jgi:hypothetical protein
VDEEMSEMVWQTIETAPKDGTPILVTPGATLDDHVYTWPERFDLQVVPARWHEPNPRTDDEAGWYAPMFWLSFGVWDDPSTDIDQIRLEPTHWMPLPSPPHDPK